ncbi:MAG: cyclic nucleotide-binding/CBS domain-containing protein [Phycisphaerae bacterium]
MQCPICSHVNIDGVDECAHCHADLSGDVAPFQRSEIERDLLTRPLGELATRAYFEVPPDRSVRATLDEWVAAGHHCAIVVEHGMIIGIVTDRDLLTKLASNLEECADKPIRDFMTPRPTTLGPEAPVVFGLHHMMVGGYRHIPVTSGDTVIGIVSVRDVLAYLSKLLDDATVLDVAS